MSNSLQSGTEEKFATRCQSAYKKPARKKVQATMPLILLNDHKTLKALVEIYCDL